jgi:hypothetical protein
MTIDAIRLKMFHKKKKRNSRKMHHDMRMRLHDIRPRRLHIGLSVFVKTRRHNGGESWTELGFNFYPGSRVGVCL